MNSRKESVILAGKKYTLTTFDSGEVIRRAEEYLNRRLSEARLVSPQADEQTIATAVAFALADEMLKAHDDNDRLRKALVDTQ